MDVASKRASRIFQLECVISELVCVRCVLPPSVEYELVGGVCCEDMAPRRFHRASHERPHTNVPIDVVIDGQIECVIPGGLLNTPMISYFGIVSNWVLIGFCHRYLQVQPSTHFGAAVLNGASGFRLM